MAIQGFAVLWLSMDCFGLRPRNDGNCKSKQHLGDGSPAKLRNSGRSRFKSTPSKIRPKAKPSLAFWLSTDHLTGQ
jgi:hypothetical protein